MDGGAAGISPCAALDNSIDMAAGSPNGGGATFTVAAGFAATTFSASSEGAASSGAC